MSELNAKIGEPDVPHEEAQEEKQVVKKKKLDLSIEELTSSLPSEFTEVEFYQGSSVN